jgi:hypothetical protein
MTTPIVNPDDMEPEFEEGDVFKIIIPVIIKDKRAIDPTS